MSPEAQQAAIAQACGWYLIQDEETNSVSLRHPVALTRYPWHREGYEQFAWEDGPDFLSDLNAMNEAEKALTEFQGHVMRQCLKNKARGTGVGYGASLCHASAAQRAEAFLRATGKWDDSK